jgi:hypothetical protein
MAMMTMTKIAAMTGQNHLDRCRGWGTNFSKFMLLGRGAQHALTGCSVGLFQVVSG